MASGRINKYMAKKIYNKNAREKALLEEAYAQVLKEGFTDPPPNILDDAPPNVTLDPIGEISGAEAYYVRINGKSVALVTRFGPRDTFTVYADPLGDGLPVKHNPDEPREDLDHKQAIGHEALIALFQSEDAPIPGHPWPEGGHARPPEPGTGI